jgi:tetratricopeptide (TPR) repeat protein
MKRCLLAFLFACAIGLPLAGQDKADALKLYRSGVDLTAVGRTDDAKESFSAAIEVCKQDLAENTKNMDAYSIYAWSLIRMGSYQDAANVCNDALKIIPDPRVMEALAESYFYLGNHKDSLKYMEKYIDTAPKGERVSLAYFFEGEIYRIAKEYHRAEIAYSAAVYLEPSMALWWYRLGTVREAVGDKAQASEAYQRALKLRPEYKEAAEGFSRVRA